MRASKSSFYKSINPWVNLSHFFHLVFHHSIPSDYFTKHCILLTSNKSMEKNKKTQNVCIHMCVYIYTLWGRPFSPILFLNYSFYSWGELWHLVGLLNTWCCDCVFLAYDGSCAARQQSIKPRKSFPLWWQKKKQMKSCPCSFHYSA